MHNYREIKSQESRVSRLSKYWLIIQCQELIVDSYSSFLFGSISGKSLRCSIHLLYVAYYCYRDVVGVFFEHTMNFDRLRGILHWWHAANKLEILTHCIPSLMLYPLGNCSLVYGTRDVFDFNFSPSLFSRSFSLPFRITSFCFLFPV